MRRSHNDLAGTFSVAAIPILVGTSSISGISGNFDWPRLLGLAILLPAGAIAIGALIIRWRSPKSKASDEKLSNRLVVLSSTAILAVYTAGYVRTKSAADRFEEQAARRRTAPPVRTNISTPAAVPPANDASPAPRRPALTGDASTATATRIPVPEQPKLPRSSLAPSSATPPSPTAASSTPGSTAPSTPPIVPAVNEPVAVASNQHPVETAPPPPPPPATPQAHYKDGMFLGWGESRHGDIQASVTIQGGRIISAEITQCLTRYSCSWIDYLPGQVITRQSADVDNVSAATESTDAFAEAIRQALSKAM